ncbi:hypothetical protein B0H14DRAFT_3710153 [Mycena olivaceomarginata]|nr:hypothetical protein B0H14DRAFT_3710153 [Mycena olivaceomarginata]
MSKQLPSTSTSSAARSTPSPVAIESLTALDLRLTSLIVRSIASNLSHHTDDPDSSISNWEQQDLLCEHLHALLPLHGRDLCASSPTWISTSIMPPQQRGTRDARTGGKRGDEEALLAGWGWETSSPRCDVEPNLCGVEHSLAREFYPDASFGNRL